MKSWMMAALAASTVLSADAASGAEGPPANLKPSHVDGAGLNCMDIEAQKAWYSAKLGMTLTNTMKAPDGSPREYIMGYGGGPDAAVVALAAVAAAASRGRTPWAASSWAGVPNAKGLADWLKTQGVDSRQVIANVAYFIADPEGNAIELYTAPKP